MRRILAPLAILLVCFSALGAYAEKAVSAWSTPPVDFPEDPDGWKLRLGVERLLNDIVAIKPVSFEFASKLGRYARGQRGLGGSSYLEAKEGEVFLVLRAELKNLSEKPIDFAKKHVFSKRMSATAVCGDVRRAGSVHQSNPGNETGSDAGIFEKEDIGRQNSRFAINYADNFPIEPGGTGHYIFCAPLPKDVLEEGGPCELLISGKNFEAVFDAASEPTSSFSTPWPPKDSSPKAFLILSQHKRLADTLGSLATDGKNLDSIQYAMNIFLQTKTAKLVEEETAKLQKERTMSTEGGDLSVVFDHIDTAKKRLGFKATIDWGAFKQGFEISLPASCLVTAPPDTLSSVGETQRWVGDLKSGRISLGFGLVYCLRPDEDGGYHALIKEVVAWEKPTGRPLGKVGGFRLEGFRLPEGWPSEAGGPLWSDEGQRRPSDGKYLAHNLWGMTKTLDQLNKEAAEKTESEFENELARLEKERENMEGPLLTGLPAPEAPSKGVGPLAFETAAAPGPAVTPSPQQVVYMEKDAPRRHLFPPTPFSFEAQMEQSLEGGPSRSWAVTLRGPSDSLWPFLRVGFEEGGAIQTGLGWDLFSSARLFSLEWLSFYWGFSGGLDLELMTSPEIAPAELAARLQCGCGLIADLRGKKARDSGKAGLRIGVSAFVGLTPTDARTELGIVCAIAPGGGR